MSNNREIELAVHGCMSPEWFLRDHIPRYAEHYGIDETAAYNSVLGEIVALEEVRNQNFRQMLDTGLAHKVLGIWASRGKLQHVGERPLIVLDNFIYMMKRGDKTNPDDQDVYYDPHNPLAIGNFHVMDDPIPTTCLDPITIGRPNSDKELWLKDGITVEDYEVVKECFYRLLALRTEGVTPHMQSHMDHVYIPYNLGHPEHPFDPNDYYHAPVEYTGFTTELKVAS